MSSTKAFYEQNYTKDKTATEQNKVKKKHNMK